MKRGFVTLLVSLTTVMQASTVQAKQVELLCHRTANEDVPENTLESLKQAALLGCNVVEVDLRRTLDGKIVMNHDGVLERLTDGIGEAEKSYYDDLKMRDAGGWMGERFAGMHIALFEDMLRLARERNIRLVLDMKTKGMADEVLRLLRQENMLDRVEFNGEWSDVKKLFPDAKSTDYNTVWVQPGVRASEVVAVHQTGKLVVANFSANDHEMDLAAMKSAVAAGVDGINTDFPRLGADAVGRPVEHRLNALAIQANAGESHMRTDAILELSRYRGFSLEGEFAHWLLDPDNNVSRAAAIALVVAKPRTSTTAFTNALQSEHADSRANAAWALGALAAPAGTLLPLLKDKDPRVLEETLIALGHMPGEVSAERLLPLFKNEIPAVRAAATVALARHQPDVAIKAVPMQLRQEMKTVMVLWENYERRGKPRLTEAESEEITGYYRCQVKMVRALSMLKGPGAIQALEEQAFRPGEDFSWSNSIMAAFQLWDRIGLDSLPAVQALGGTDVQVADRAEWILVQGGPAVLPEVRKALGSDNPIVRERAIRILAWQGDVGSLKVLRVLKSADLANAALVAWAIEKIEALHPTL